MPDWLSNALEYVLDFSNVLNASISASWLILIVIALRLLMPFSIESAFSLIPSAETVSTQLLQAEAVAGKQSAYLDIVTNPAYGGSVSVGLDTTISAFRWELVDLTFLWIAGMAVMVLYTSVTYWRLRKKVDTAVILRENIFCSEYVGSPFVLGILKPKIYLPYAMDEQNMEHVIAHEQVHIHRKDHWWNGQFPGWRFHRPLFYLYGTKTMMRCQKAALNRELPFSYKVIFEFGIGSWRSSLPSQS